MIDLLITLLTGANATFWILSNLLIAYIAAMLVIFGIAYPVFFDPLATTAGKFVLLFALSLIGVIGLVFIGLFIDPRNGVEWWQYPPDIYWWRPAVRLAVYTCVAFTITGLVVVLWLRKFRPQLLKTAPGTDQSIPIKPRRPKEHP
ncbi:hypothetical protein [Rathayibacter sp. AY1B8]|uniref:putative phage holin n=1 Tax=Rathayibacter sp. AY1B8 TaxID=2080533 RepID=UPI000CE86EC6|nr:hypothetical protein [Rathayibacter sp. AY1B8]PPI08243.1 hypothetical protein C5C63_04620 [Rathayibacter sp. AY1B8]